MKDETLFYKLEGSEKIFLDTTLGIKINKKSSLFPIPINNENSLKDMHEPVLVFKKDELIVSVGKNPHPMTREHHINWIYIKTVNGGILNRINFEKTPIVSFKINKEEFDEAFIYCNLHGLWSNKIFSSYTEDQINETVCSADFSNGCREYEEEEM